jgi:endonuclease YncB( thermonuclease family)
MPKGKVTKIIDGYTLQVKGGTRIRLAGIDAPEKPRKGGIAAINKLSDLVKGKTISYSQDAYSYGRTVGEVKLGPKSVNKEMQKFLNKQK